MSPVLRVNNSLLLLISLFGIVNSLQVIPLVDTKLYSKNINFSLHSKLFNDESYDDEIGEGRALAKDFYDEMRRRTTKTEEDNEVTESPILDSISAPNPSPQVDTGSSPTAPPTAPIKFTGRSSSPQRFTNNSGGGATNRDNMTVQERMMEREYRLVERAERNLLIQGAFAVLALAFYIYIGISGGITNRSEESLENFGGDDMIPFEQVAPIQRDREESVWL